MVRHNKTFELYLPSRTNVIVRHWNGIPIVIYDDHRWLLNVLYAMQKYNYEIPNLIFFDAHDDYGNVNLNGADLLKKMEVNKWDEVDERKFLDFVEFEADPDDGNWLRIACELDIVNDVALIGGEKVRLYIKIQFIKVHYQVRIIVYINLVKTSIHYMIMEENLIPDLGK